MTALKNPIVVDADFISQLLRFSNDALERNTKLDRQVSYLSTALDDARSDRDKCCIANVQQGKRIEELEAAVDTHSTNLVVEEREDTFTADVLLQAAIGDAAWYTRQLESLLQVIDSISLEGAEEKFTKLQHRVTRIKSQMASRKEARNNLHAGGGLSVNGGGGSASVGPQEPSQSSGGGGGQANWPETLIVEKGEAKWASPPVLHDCSCDVSIPHGSGRCSHCGGLLRE